MVVNKKFTYSLQQYYRDRLYIGDGCCCGLNSWRQDVKPRRDIDIINPVVEVVENSHIDYKVVFEEFIRGLAREFMSGDKIALTCYSLSDRLEKRGYTKDQIDIVMQNIQYNFNEHRSTMMKDFMG